MPTPANEIVISILILSIPNRIQNNLIPLYNKLLKQSEKYPQVEILCLIDNKTMTVGEKRQSLLDCARGQYIGFMDDDDDVSDDYIESLISAARKNPDADVITFDQHCVVNGMEFTVNFSIQNSNQKYVPGMKHVLRPPFHICFWNNKIAKAAKFESSSYGEDYAWCLQMYPFVKNEEHIERQIHLYRYDDRTSETIQYANSNPVLRLTV